MGGVMHIETAIQRLEEACSIAEQLDRASHGQVQQLLDRLNRVLANVGAELEAAKSVPVFGEHQERVAKFVGKPMGFALMNTFLDIKSGADQQTVLSVALMAANREGGA
jgi:hypothetical protein